MKKNIIFFLVIIVGTLRAQTNNNIYSLSHQELPSRFTRSNDYSRTLGNTAFQTTMGGAVDTVWQHIDYNPEQHDIVTNEFFAASDGSFYFASYRINRGGFFTKINGAGTIEWTINRKFSGDTSKYYILFENISELPNGDILVYGYEGKVNQYRIYDIFPIRFIISPEGVVKEEKATRTVLPEAISNTAVYTIFPDTRVYVNTESFDSISVFSMDTSFTKIQNTLSFKNEYKGDMFDRIRGVLPYDSSSFIVVNAGLFPSDTARSVTLLRYSKEFELLNQLIIHTEDNADVAICNDGLYFILQGNKDRKFLTSKYDNKGNMLWKKQPELLKKFEFVYFEITKGQNGGFFITGEIYSFKDNGSVSYSEAHTGIIAKLNDEGECEWYYTTGNKILRNLILNFDEALNGDVVFVCNSMVYDLNLETSIQITRLRLKATGVFEQPSSTSDGISIYPNPTSTSLTISGLEGSTSLRIMNSLGMEVASQQVLSGKAEIDVTTLTNGMYFASFLSATGTVVKPIVVSH